MDESEDYFAVLIEGLKENLREKSEKCNFSIASISSGTETDYTITTTTSVEDNTHAITSFKDNKITIYEFREKVYCAWKLCFISSGLVFWCIIVVLTLMLSFCLFYYYLCPSIIIPKNSHILYGYKVSYSFIMFFTSFVFSLIYTICTFIITLSSLLIIITCLWFCLDFNCPNKFLKDFSDKCDYMVNSIKCVCIEIACCFCCIITSVIIKEHYDYY
jgi:hypothetical protein